MARQPKNIRVTERDHALMTDLARAGGVLDSRTIRERQYPNDKTGEACLRRLRYLQDHELIVAVRASVTFGPAPVGRLPLVLGLASKGADLLCEITGERVGPTVTTLSSQHLEHRVGMGKLRLLVHDACRLEGFGEPQWIGEYDPRPGPPPGINAKLSKRFRLCHQYETVAKATLTCWPDGACLLAIRYAEAVHHLLALFEYDRSTERLAQVRAKLPAYERFFRSGDHLALFPGIEKLTARIFFVVQSEDRRQNIADAIKDVATSDVVRFGVHRDLSAKSFFRDKVWFTPKGEAKEIMPKRNP